MGWITVLEIILVIFAVIALCVWWLEGQLIRDGLTTRYASPEHGLRAAIGFGLGIMVIGVGLGLAKDALATGLSEWSATAWLWWLVYPVLCPVAFSLGWHNTLPTVAGRLKKFFRRHRRRSHKTL